MRMRINGYGLLLLFPGLFSAALAADISVVGNWSEFIDMVIY